MAQFPPGTNCRFVKCPIAWPAILIKSNFSFTLLQTVDSVEIFTVAATCSVGTLGRLLGLGPTRWLLGLDGNPT